MGKILEMKNISKSFSGVEVLKNMDFSLEEGEVRALLGANGAGKSTLMKILCGVYTATAGEVYLDGKPLALTSPSSARDAGIAMVHQELSIIGTLTVLQNYFLGSERVKKGLLSEKEMRKEYDRVREEFGFDIDPDVKAKTLSIAKQQMVEIMKTLGNDARIIVLDEPTTSLTNDEKQSLFALVKELKRRGKTIIYISHLLEEVFALTDNATIMRNGEIVGTFPTSELTIPLISEYMTGAKVVHSKHNSSVQQETKPVLKVRNLTAKKVHDVSFEVYPGEILGLAGLVGAGRSEIVRALFGADKATGGVIEVDGKTVSCQTPEHAIRSGIGLIPEDRKGQGILPKLAIFKNASLVQLKKLRKHGMLSEKVEKDYIADAQQKLSIKYANSKDPISSLSGGNQQKVVISKWMSEDFRVLIFDEPTKGVDIGAKEDIFHIIESFAAMGMGILFISSDLEEVLRVSDRILVVRGGQVVDSFPNRDISQQDIMDAILKTDKTEE